MRLLASEARWSITRLRAASPHDSIRSRGFSAESVMLSDELVSLMSAESGAQIVQMYDQLIGQAVTTLDRLLS